MSVTVYGCILYVYMYGEVVKMSFAWLLGWSIFLICWVFDKTDKMLPILA